MSIEAIRAALEAMPNEADWEAAESGGAIDVLDDLGGVVCEHVCGRDYAAFIAACNPSAIRELLDRLEAAEKAVQWKPIETAPKDFVTEFDGWNGERVPNVSWAHPGCAAKGEYDWCVSEYISGHGYENARVRGLTHWMPLPAAPAAMEGE